MSEIYSKGNVGISVDVNFNATESLKNLKQTLDESLKDLGDRDIELKFSTGKVKEQLEEMGEQFEKMKSQIDKSFNDLDLNGLERLVTVLKDLGNIDSKLEINVFKKVKEDIAGVAEEVEKTKKDFEELAEQEEKFATLGKSIGDNIELLRSSTGEVVSGFRMVVGEAGQMEQEILSTSEAVSELARRTKEAGIGAKSLYSRYEKATAELQKLEESMKNINRDEVSEETLQSYEKLKEYYKQIAQEAMADIKTLGLVNKEIEKRIDLSAKEKELKDDIDNSNKRDVVNNQKMLEDSQKEINLIKEKRAEIEATYEKALELRKALLNDNYVGNLDTSREEDEEELRSLNSKIGGFKRTNFIKENEELSSVMAEYQKKSDKMTEWENQEKAEAKDAKNLAKYEEAESKINELLGKRLDLIKKVGSTTGEVKANLLKEIDELKAESDKMLNFYRGYGREKLKDLDSDFTFKEKLFESNQDYKEMNNTQKQIMSNLREINKLASQNIRTDSEDVRLKNEKQIEKIERRMAGLRESLTLDQRITISRLEDSLKLERDKLQTIQDEKTLKEWEIGYEKEQEELEKNYTALLLEDIKLQKEKNSAVSDEKRLQVGKQLLELDERKREMIQGLTLDKIAQLSSIEKEINAQEDSNTVESKTVALIQEQKSLYKELLGLQQERLRVTNEIEKTSSYDGQNLMRLKSTHEDLTGRIVETRGAILNGGMFSETMEEENRAILGNSKAMAILTKTRTNNARKIELVNEQLKDYQNTLDKIADKEGRAIATTKEFANASERLKIALDSDDLSIKQLALGGISNAMDELDRKVNRTDEAMHKMFERWKDFIGYTAVSMATTGVLGSFDNAWEQIKKVNEAYTEVHKVYDADIDGNNGWKATNWIQTANTMGQKYGFATSDTLDAIYQAINYGYGNREQALNMAKSSMILSNTGKISEEDASKDLISIMKGFYGDRKPLSTEMVDGKSESLIQSVIDKLSQGGMYYPITSGGIAEALKRGGSSMVGMGTNLEQAIQLIVAGNYSRQDPATVGNSMKSIYGSFTQLFTQDSKADLRKRKQLLGLTGNIYTNGQGQLYNPYEILTKLAQQVNDGKFDRTQIGEIADLLGGKTQLGVVYSLLTHLTGVEAKQKKLNSNPLTQAYGSAERENAKYMESMVARLNQMKQTVLDIWLKIINSKVTMVVLDTGVKLLSILNEIMGKIGVIPTILAGLMTYFTAFNRGVLKNFGKPFQKIGARLINMFRAIRGEDAWRKIPQKEQEETNADLKKALRERAILEQQAKESSVENAQIAGEEVSTAFAKGIEAKSSAVEEAMMGQTDLVREQYQELVEELFGEEAEDDSLLDSIRGKNVVLTEEEQKMREVLESTEIDMEEKTKVFSEEFGLSMEESASKVELLIEAIEKLNSVGTGDMTEASEIIARDNESIADSAKIATGAIEEENVAMQEQRDVRNTTPVEKVRREAENSEEHATGEIAETGESILEDGEASEIPELALGGLAGGVVGFLGMGAIAGATYGISALYDEYEKEQQEKDEEYSKELAQIKDNTNTSEHYENQIEAMESFVKGKQGQTLDKLNSQYQAGTLQGSGLQQYYTLMKKVANIAPELVAFKGANGNPYLDMENGVKGLVTQLKDAKNAQDQLNLSTQAQQKFTASITTQREKINEAQNKANTQYEKHDMQETLHPTAMESEVFINGQVAHKYNEEMSTSQLGAYLTGRINDTAQKYKTDSEYYSKLNTLNTNAFINSELPELFASTGTLGELDKNSQKFITNLLKSTSIGAIKTTKQFNAIVQSMGNQLTSGSKTQQEEAKQQLSSVTYSLEKFRAKYSSGDVHYSAQQLEQIHNFYVNELHSLGISKPNAQQLVNFKYLAPPKSFINNLYNLVANKFKLSDAQKKATYTVSDTVSKAIGAYISTMGSTTKNGKDAFNTSVDAIFTSDKKLGRELADKMGVALNVSIPELTSMIKSNPQLKKLGGEMLYQIMTGQKVNPKVEEQFDNEVTQYATKAQQKVEEVGKTGKYAITIPIKVNSKGIENSAIKDGKTYAKKFQISSTTAGKIIDALGLTKIAEKDGATYKATAEQKAKAYGQVLHDKNVLDIAYKDGSLWAGKVRMTAKQVGQVLHALGVTGIAEKDGELYAGKVRITAKQAGKVLNDALASYTGSKDGSLYASSASKTAVASGKVQADLSQIRQSASGAAQYWRITFESIVRGVTESASWLEKNLNRPISSFFMAMPTPKMDLGNTKISGHQTLAQNLMTALQPTVHSAFASAKGGVSASVGGKGGSGAVGMGAVSFATTGISSSNTGSDMVASGVEELDTLGGLVPSNSTFAQAGASAGYSYVSSYSQIMNSLLNEEATQYQRLQNINETYFDTDTNNLKLSIDLNERLKNTITDIGNAISHNQALQTETESGYQAIDLMKQELSLLNQKKQANEALEDSYEKQLSLMKSSLENQGFQFNKNGDITNALAKLQGLENWVNKMPDEIQQSKTTEHYTKTPYTYYKYGKGSETEVPYHYYKNVGGHYISKSATYWDYKLGKDVTKTWKEWVAGTKKEINGDYKKYAEGKKTLETGYKYSKTPETTTDEVTNQAKQKASQTVQNLQNMVNAYNSMLHQTLPQTTSAIDQINQQVEQMYNSMLQTASSVESQITQVIQKQISERKQAIQNSANEETKALQKQLTAMQQQQSTESYNQGLAQQQAQLATLQKQIDNAELDHSLVGQANLSALQKQYKALQKQIDQTIQNHNEQQAQQTIQNKINSINQNAQDQQNAIDKTWNTAKIAETVKNAILNGSFTDVNGQIVKTKTTWVEFANEFSNGLGVMGNKMKDDFIKQLEEAQKIMENINSINHQMGYYNTSSATPSWVVPQQDSSFMALPPMGFDHRNARMVVSNNNHQINFNSPLVNVQGNVSNANDLHKFTKDLEQKVTKHIVKNLRNTGAI